jgi:hypothetical protein
VRQDYGFGDAHEGRLVRQDHGVGDAYEGRPVRQVQDFPLRVGLNVRQD